MRLRLWIAIALLAALAMPGAAHASGAAVIRDCTDDGALSKRYSQQDYAKALADLPADVDEYSNCRDVIQRARLGGAAVGGSGGGGTGGGGGFTGGIGGTGGGDGLDGGGSAGPSADPLQGATPEERAAFDKAVGAGSAPVTLDGRPIRPGALGGSTVTDLNDLPAPLLAVLALLAVGALGAGAYATRHLVLRRGPA